MTTEEEEELPAAQHGERHLEARGEEVLHQPLEDAGRLQHTRQLEHPKQPHQLDGQTRSQLRAVVEQARVESGVRSHVAAHPGQLAAQMGTLLLDPTDIEHANIRAAIALAFQGLLRGAEITADGKFSPVSDLSRADIVSLNSERLVLMMRPCKNMHHLSGKTVPLIIGAGGEYIDAVAEMRNLFDIDPVPVDRADTTPLFRTGRSISDRKALKTDVLRAWVKTLAVRNGDPPEHFGTHSMRIGGATALFAAGADPTVIRTMGRWSSDCYRLYVRACFEQTLSWSRQAGSQVVTDVAQEFSEVDSY